MKNIILLFTLLIPIFLFAQYPATGNKQRLGWQTTGDGLVYRGSGVPAYVPSTRNNAYVYQDTVANRYYHYSSGAWRDVSDDKYIIKTDASMLAAPVKDSLTIYDRLFVAMEITSGAISDRGVQLPVTGLDSSYAGRVVRVSSLDSSATSRVFVSSSSPDGLGIGEDLATTYYLENGETVEFQLYVFDTLYQWRLVHTNEIDVLGSFSATLPLQYNNTTGVFSILQANTSQSGFLSSTDWNTFNNSPDGSGTTNRSARWTSSTALAAGNFTDDGSVVAALLPFGLPSYTTVGIPLAANTAGRLVYDQTVNGFRGYSTAGFYLLESTFARGTNTRIPFFDANGRVTESANLLYNGNLALTTASSTNGIDLVSTVSGNAGTLRIRPNSAPVGSAGDFTISNLTGGARLFFSNFFQVLFSATQGISTNVVTATFSLTVGSSSLSDGNLALRGVANTTHFLSWNNNKQAIHLAPTGSFERANMHFVLNNEANLNAYNVSNDTKMLLTVNGNLTIGSTTEDANAILNLVSTSKGFLTPRMTSAQRTAISSPASSLMLFDTDSLFHETYISGGWKGFAYRDWVRANFVATGGSYAGWNLRANGDAVTNVASTNTVQLLEGYGIDVTRSGLDVTIKADTAQVATLYDLTQKTWLKPELEGGNDVNISQDAVVLSFEGANTGITITIDPDDVNEKGITVSNSFTSSVLSPDIVSVQAGAVESRLTTNIISITDGTNTTSLSADLIIATAYGTGTKEAADLLVTESDYVAVFATNGTVAEKSISSLLTSNTISQNNVDYTVLSAFKSNTVITMSVDGSGTSDSQVLLPTPGATQLGKVLFVVSFDSSGSYNNALSGGTNEIYATGSYSNAYSLSAGQTVRIVCVQRPDTGAYVWSVN